MLRLLYCEVQGMCISINTGVSHMIPSQSKVVVIGGGPAGSLAAGLLAREGVEVVLFEKTQFPRYHIGESLLVAAMPILEFAGALEKIDAHGFIKKPGGIFKIKQDAEAGYVNFAKLGKYPYAYQVIRSEFDHLLLNHARELGAKVYESTLVKKIEFNNEVPVAVEWEQQGQSGRTEFDYLVDASGLSALMSINYLKNREYQPTFENVALGGYWKNAGKISGDREGAIFIEALSNGAGWTWSIPLHDETLSVGIVIHQSFFDEMRKQKKDTSVMYHELLKLTPDTVKLIGDNAELTAEKIHVWKDYSYAAREFAGTKFRLIGDAAGFIDPFFSTGVHMSLLGGLSAAATICGAIRGEISESDACAYHEKLLRQAYLRFLFSVAGVYRQIRNQDEVVLNGISHDNFQLAFDFLQPIVSGNVDMNLNIIPPKMLDKTMKYLGGLLLDMHGFDSGSSVSRLMSTQGAKLDSYNFAPTNSINGYYIRMKSGKFGMAKISWLQKFRNTVEQVIRNNAIKIADMIDGFKKEKAI